MADTTIDNVILMAPDLAATLTQPKFDLYLSDAKLELEKYKVPETIQEKCQRLMVAHYATISKSGGNVGGSFITKKKLGPLEISYGQTSSANTESSMWLDELTRLLKRYGVIGMKFELFS